jgi:hypothetical protein
MESSSRNRFTESGLRDRCYAVRHPFAADAEIFDLKSGCRLTGVTSDLSLRGCFVCTRRLLDIGARVRLTLTRKDQNVMALAVVRVAKPRAGMGLEFLEVDADSTKSFLAWIGNLRQLR